MKAIIKLIIEIIGLVIEVYRKWFWVVGIISLVICLFGNSFLGSVIPFMVGLAFFTLAMGIDNFFREKPFNHAGFALWILGAFILSCIFMVTVVVAFQIFRT